MSSPGPSPTYPATSMESVAEDEASTLALERPPEQPDLFSSQVAIEEESVKSESNWSIGPASKDLLASTIAELNSLKETNEQLRLQIEAFQSQEQDRSREQERLLAEVENGNITKTALQTRIQELQTELKESRKAQQSIEDEKNTLEVELSELQEALEIMTLDKEMAEEKVDALQAEIDIAKEKIEELAIEVEVLKEEKETSVDMPSDAGSADVNLLTRQNERLREALMKLRDVSLRQEAEQKDAINELKQEVSNLNHLRDVNEQLSEQLKKAEYEIEQLKESLDGALGAEQMKVEELKSAVADLEALRDLNDELEENHVLTEKELQAEIESKDTLIAELRRRNETQEEMINDHERVIYQFRTLTRKLQSEISEKKNSAETEGKGDESAIRDQTRDLMNLNLRLQNTEFKSRLRAIEIDLKQLEVLQAQEHLDILKHLQKVNNLIESLKTEELLTETVSDEILRSCSHLERVANSYSPLAKINPSSLHEEIRSSCEVLRISVDRLISETNRLEAIFEGSTYEEDLDLRAQLELVKVTFFANMGSMKKTAGDIKAFVRYVKIEFGLKLLQAKCANLIGNISTYWKERLESNTLPEIPVLVQLSTSSSEALLGIVETNMGEALCKVLSEVLHSLEDCDSKILEKNAGGGTPTVVAPWVKRAEVVKKEFTMNADLEKQIETLNAEILSLVRDLKAKDQQNEEYAVKVDILEHKIENVRKYMDAVNSLEEEVHKLREKEREYTEVIEQLTNENMSIEQENLKFKKLIGRQENADLALATASKELASAREDILRSCCQPRVVDISTSASKKAPKWVRLRNNPFLQYEQQLNTLERLGERTSNLFMTVQKMKPPELTGPLVVLVHGYPDLWYGWRHQIRFLSEHGFRVIAPDVRGYGKSDGPIAPEDYPQQYGWKNVCKDLIELVDHVLGKPNSSAIYIGHDWGGMVVWRMCLHYPERISAVGSICTAYTPPSSTFLPLDKVVEFLPQFQYQRWLVRPSTVEELEKNAERFFQITFRASGESADLVSLGDKGLSAAPKTLPPSSLFSSADLQYYVDNYKARGFKSSLYYYKTRAVNFDEEKGLPKQINHPALLITAKYDAALPPSMSAKMEQFVTRLTRKACTTFIVKLMPR
ncbi:hypothetical protein HDU96_004367 [Phlyctochytrium bullatum]|nr:hypothetical protein HDU96_004367 [Phlyctochytrium bullatum]